MKIVNPIIETFSNVSQPGLFVAAGQVGLNEQDVQNVLSLQDRNMGGRFVDPQMALKEMFNVDDAGLNRGMTSLLDALLDRPLDAALKRFETGPNGQPY